MMDKQEVIEEIKGLIPRVVPGAEVIFYESVVDVELAVVLDKEEVTKEDADTIFLPLEAIESRLNYEIAILPMIFTRAEWAYHRLLPSFYDTSGGVGATSVKMDLGVQSVLFSQRSHHSLTSARILLDHHLTDDCMNCLYAAVFYAVRAALLSKGIEVCGTVHTRTMLSRYFVDTGLLSRDICRIFFILFTRIHALECNSDLSVLTCKEATSLYESTVLFIESIESVSPRGDVQS
jgi:uncharacterized protein (UPF0332 family)